MVYASAHQRPDPPPWQYVHATAYQLSVDVLNHRDPTGVVFATHALYTALGHRRGGCDTPDAQLGAFLGASTETLRRARRILTGYGVLEERRRGRTRIRATRRPATFVHLPAIAIRAFLSGRITARQLRLYAYTVHKRAEYGESAGCGLTRDELARGLDVRPDTISADVHALDTAGLLHLATRRGTGWILTPKYAAPLRRRIAPAALADLRNRRRRWNLHRPGFSTGPRPELSTTGRSRVGPAALSGVGTPHPTRAPSAQVAQLSPPTATRTTAVQRGPVAGRAPSAPWDAPGATWRPPDWRHAVTERGRNAAPRPPAADWRAYRPSRA